MISKCANPACNARFLYLHEGKLFRVLRGAKEAPHLQKGVDPTVRKHAQHVEFFWLCEECTAKMTIKYENGAEVVVKPLYSVLRAVS
jgi:hypothetical protein